MPICAYPFQRECAYRTADDGGLVLIPAAEAGEDHSDVCEVRVSFDVIEFYPPEPSVGAGWDWNGDIETIEVRILGEGSRFRRFRVLTGAEFTAARAMLLREFGQELWDAGGDFAKAAYYEEAA